MTHGPELTPHPQVQAEILAGCPRLDPVAIAPDQALGMVLARAVVSSGDLPPFANTAMDGYAVRAADVAGAPVVLDVVATVAAGATGQLPGGADLGPGQAVRIMTGAPIPPGADAVVMVERTRDLDGGARVEVSESVAAGNFVRRPGEDVAAEQEVFAAGTVVGPGHVGLLAALGTAEVDVHPVPRVGVLSTGDELAPAGVALASGQIRDSNGPTLRALVAWLGFVPVDLGTAGDDLDAIEAALAHGVATCDAVVCTGGVSVGDFDYVTAALGRLGPARAWSVAIKPGKPLAFTWAGAVPVFGLPGNPVSSMVSFELFTHPMLRRMAGREPAVVAPVRAVAEADLARRPDGKVHLMRVLARTGPDGRLSVGLAGGQGSHMLRAMAVANALAVVPDGPGVRAGAEVEVLLLGESSGRRRP